MRVQLKDRKRSKDLMLGLNETIYISCLWQIAFVGMVMC